MQETVKGNTMDSQEAKMGLAPKAKKNQKSALAVKNFWLP
jgi:hypothetical protein